MHHHHHHHRLADLGFSDVGWKNRNLVTPHLDALAAGGVVRLQCCTTRAPFHPFLFHRCLPFHPFGAGRCNAVCVIQPACPCAARGGDASGGWAHAVPVGAVRVYGGVLLAVNTHKFVLGNHHDGC